MKSLYRATKHSKANRKYLDMIGYYLSRRDYGAVNALVRNVGEFTKCPDMKNRVNNLFLTRLDAKEYFGLAEDIVGSMANIVFAGNVNIRVEDEEIQRLIDGLMYDGYFINTLREAYKTAISMSGEARAYLFFNTIQEYESVTNVKINDKFLDFEVVPTFMIEKSGKNIITRLFHKEVDDEFREYKYNYMLLEDSVELYIEGYNDKGDKLSDIKVMEDLKIDTVKETFDFIPFIELNVGDGMLPNILWIENSLAENLYFQDEDLVNSQTTTYIPADHVFEGHLNDNMKISYFDKYQTRKVVAGSILDKVESISHVMGQSAIKDIERNLALNVIQGCLDAKMSPVSLGYLPTDKMGSNTDIGADKERVSIRKRETDIIRLKTFISKSIQTYLRLHDIYLDILDMAVLFDPYITPSIESKTNTLSKQVQFGIKSREMAVRELNENELSEEEIVKEYERIKELGTQIDYNVEQRQQMNKGETNILKSEK